MKHYILSLVETDEQAQDTIRLLTSVGVSTEDVLILNPSQRNTEDFADHKETKEGEHQTGIKETGLLGGVGPALVGAAGPFAAASSIMSAYEAQEAVEKGGRVSGALVRFGISEDAAERYEGKLAEGGVLIAVRADKGKPAIVARKALEEARGQEISEA